MYDYLDLRQTERLKELVPYKVLAPDADEIIKELDRLNNIINELEKDINNQLMMTRKMDKYNEGFFNATLHFYNKLKALKENNK